MIPIGFVSESSGPHDDPLGHRVWTAVPRVGDEVTLREASESNFVVTKVIWGSCVDGEEKPIDGKAAVVCIVRPAVTGLPVIVED